MELNQKKITVAGVLVPDQWTEDGEISGFALCTNDEQQYAIKSNTGKDALMVMLRQNIEVSGIVADNAGKKTLSVICLRPLPSIPFP